MRPFPTNPPADVGDKKRLRRELRQARRNLNSEDQARAARGLLENMLNLHAFQAAQRIAMYLANDGEIDTREVINWCYQEGKQAFLPVVQQSEGRNWLLFGALTPESTFEPNSLGIAEPVLDRESLLPADAMDLVLVPLVGFDSRGSRVGMGGGFYDTTFEFLHKSQVNRPRLVGVAHEIQRVERIEVESWDIPLPVVVTDRNIYRFES